MDNRIVVGQHENIEFSGIQLNIHFQSGKINFTMKLTNNIFQYQHGKFVRIL